MTRKDLGKIVTDTYPDGTPLPVCVVCREPIQGDEPICHRGWILTSTEPAQWQMDDQPDCAHVRCVFDFREKLGLGLEPRDRDW